MLVIIEGPDGSGKTSLVRRLRQGLVPYTWILKSNSKPRTIDHMTAVTEWIRLHPPELPLICDRYPLISELVYGPIIRGACLHSMNVKQVADYLHDGPPTLVIYCRPTMEHIRRGSENNPQMEGVPTHLLRLTSGYDSVMDALKKEGMDVKEYDYTKSHRATDVMYEIERLLRQGDSDELDIEAILPGRGDDGHSDDAP